MKRLKTQQGQSFVETIIAVAILAVSAAGISGSLISLGQAKKKAVEVEFALTLEAAFVAAVSDQSNYDDSIRNSLRAGTVPTNLSLALKLPQLPQGQNVNLIRNQNLFLTRQLSPCAALDGRDCIYELVFDVRRSSPDGQVTPIYGVAYSIRTETDQSLPLQLGSSFPFAATAFGLEIPPSMYSMRDESRCAEDELFVMGMNRATGQVICVKKPIEACADNEVITGLRVGLNNNLQPQLQLHCQAVQASLSCENNFSLQDVSLVGYSLVGQCIYAGSETDSWSGDIVNGAGSTPEQLEALACPENYSVEPTNTCDIVTTRNVVGSTTYIASWTENASDWSSAGGPWPDPNNASQQCAERRFVSYTPNFGTHIVDLSSHVQLLTTGTGRTRGCRISVPQATHGALWEGYLRYTPSCRLNPEFRAPRAATPGGP